MEEHSKNYDKVKRYYDMGMWNEVRVRNAVKMNWITEEEFTESDFYDPEFRVEK